MGRLKGVATGGQDHEPSADKVRTIKQLKHYLCDLAWPVYGKADPEMCRICPSQCAYGRRFLELTEEENTMPRKENAREPTAEETIEKLRGELAQERQQRKAAENKLLEAKKELEGTEVELKELQEIQNSQAVQMAGLRGDLANARQKCKELEAENDAMGSMEAELKKLEAERCELEQLNNVMADVNVGLEEEIAKLRKQLEEERAGQAEMEMKLLRMKAIVFDLEHEGFGVA